MLIKSEGGILYENPSWETGNNYIVLTGRNWTALILYKHHPMLPGPAWTGDLFYHDHYHPGHSFSSDEELVTSS